MGAFFCFDAGNNAKVFFLMTFFPFSFFLILSPQNRVRIAAGGGIQAVLAVMRAHAADADLLADCCGALRNVSADNVEVPTFLAFFLPFSLSAAHFSNKTPALAFAV